MVGDEVGFLVEGVGGEVVEVGVVVGVGAEVLLEVAVGAARVFVVRGEVGVAVGVVGGLEGMVGALGGDVGGVADIEVVVAGDVAGDVGGVVGDLVGVGV